MSGGPRLAWIELAQQPQAWAATPVQAIKVATQYLHHAPEPELAALIRALAARHVALAMEGLLLIESERCGRGVESYAGATAIPAIAERVKRAGGTLAYVAMDEPVWFGTRWQGSRACHDTVPEVAQQMARSVDILRQAFPALRFCDIEPLNGHTQGLINDIMLFADRFRQATGVPVSCLHADLIWQAPDAMQQLATWKRAAKGAGMAFGVIFNGDPADKSDQAWAEHAVQRHRLVQSDPTIAADTAVFQTWMAHPTRLLPDSDPGTLAGVIVRAQP
jgi:hypothetical protein